jgi:hypothetical protein
MGRRDDSPYTNAGRLFLSIQRILSILYNTSKSFIHKTTGLSIGEEFFCLKPSKRWKQTAFLGVGTVNLRQHIYTGNEM